MNIEGKTLTNLIIVKKKGGDDFNNEEDDNYIATDLLGWLEECNGQNKNKSITLWREVAIDKDTYLIACNGSPVIDNYDIIKNGYKYDELMILDVKGILVTAYPWFCEQTDTINSMIRIYNEIIKSGHANINLLCRYDENCNDNGEDPIEWLMKS